MADYTVTRSEIRGQCDKGHVLIAEVFGPELTENWLDSCPLPACGFEIKWERRPDWMGPRPVIAVDRLAQIIRTVDGNHQLGAGALAEAIVAELGKER